MKRFIALFTAIVFLAIATPVFARGVTDQHQGVSLCATEEPHGAGPTHLVNPEILVTSVVDGKEVYAPAGRTKAEARAAGYACVDGFGAVSMLYAGTIIPETHSVSAVHGILVQPPYYMLE